MSVFLTVAECDESELTKAVFASATRKSGRRLKIDVAAAGRFIRHAIAKAEQQGTPATMALENPFIGHTTQSQPQPQPQPQPRPRPQPQHPLLPQKKRKPQIKNKQLVVEPMYTNSDYNLTEELVGGSSNTTDKLEYPSKGGAKIVRRSLRIMMAKEMRSRFGMLVEPPPLWFEQTKTMRINKSKQISKSNKEKRIREMRHMGLTSASNKPISLTFQIGIPFIGSIDMMKE